MKLIIGEKPSLARTIADALGAKKRGDGFIEGNGYLVSWCFGHLYELFELEQYFKPDFKKGDKANWRESMAHLPFYPDNWQFQYSPMNDSGVKKQIKILRELMNRADVDTIYAAGDADREGEVIVRLVIDNNLKSQKKLMRLWLPALTPEAIRDGVKDAKSDEEYTNLYHSGKTRAAVDWLMGIELTRYCSVKSGSFVRVGRCVCPIVSKVVEREKEIKNFVPIKYFAVESKTTNEKGEEFTLTCKETYSLEDGQRAADIAMKYNAAGAVVTDISTKEKEVKAGHLFSMSDLQSFLCKKDKSLSPSDVLEAVQKLYEAAYVTYPRTSSNFLAQGESARVDGIIRAFHDAGITGIVNKPGDKRIYDDSKVESHSGLTPTDKIPDISSLGKAEALAYAAIRDRFFAAFCEEPCLYNETEMIISCNGEDFKVKGSVLIQEGWQRFEAVSKKEKTIPGFQKGDSVPVDFKPVEKETTPPKRFTVESLNAWMKAPLKKAEKSDEYTDEEWKDILSEATICTEATRADTIDRCIKSKYIALKNGSYMALDGGFFMDDVLKSLNIDLSVQSTVDLSRDLHSIAVGEKSPETVFSKTKDMLDKVFGNESASIKSEFVPTASSKESLGNCPRCGSAVYEGQKNFYCSNKDCSFSIWKSSKFLEGMKKTVNKTMCKSLLKSGRTHCKDLYSQKKQKTFAADLVLDDTGQYVNFKLEFK